MSFSTASAAGSVTKASISAMARGRPVRSRASRRASVVRSAAGCGVSFSASSRARMKRSTSFFGQDVFFTAGTAGRLGGTYAQCGSYSAPAAIHRFRSSICLSGSRSPASGGGITRSGSVEVIRAMISLSSGFPGTIAAWPPRSAVAPANVSSRRPSSPPPWRSSPSGPWQRTQRLERMPLMSRVNEGAGSAATDTCAASR